MDSIQVVRLQDVLRVTSITNAVGVSPRSIIVNGEDFRYVETVLINGISSPEFAVLSPTQLVAQVPADQASENIVEVSVLSSALTMTERSVVQLTVGPKPKKVSGSVRLMQIFIRHLLRTPGTNIFQKRSGGGLAKRIGTNNDRNTAADIAVAINTTKTYVMSTQASDRNIPPSERLLSAEISGMDVNPESTEVSVTVIITSHAGVRSAATLTM